MVRDLNIRKKTAQPRNMVWALRIKKYMYIYIYTHTYMYVCMCAWVRVVPRKKPDVPKGGQLRPRVLIRSWWEGILKWLDVLVGGFNLPLRKMMESVGMMTFPIWWESHKNPWFQTTNQYKNNLSLLGMVQGYGSYPSEVYESWVLGIDQGPTFWAVYTAYINIIYIILSCLVKLIQFQT